MHDWSVLNTEQKMRLSDAAMRTAAEVIAGHAEVLASEIEDGSLSDRGGPDALRLLASMVRLFGRDPGLSGMATAGCA